MYSVHHILRRKTEKMSSGNKDLIEALNQIEKEKDISKEVLFEAIENSLLAACKNEFGKDNSVAVNNIKVNINRENGNIEGIGTVFLGQG